ncbi:winged helix-turn-helix domain-containing protein [Robbsia sp. KACC 23696]|uniref:winged helix-turn-helix domain-containing protein n=1 Tax=Robbsia sp. KACC 23696 TaxID=3149231 RepID=UPI00325BBA3B
MNNAAPLYVQFLHIVQTTAADVGLPKLDAVEEEILNTIARFQAAGQPLCVKELLHNAHLGSPSRIFDRLRAMRANGWLQLLDTSDNRRKHVVLTEDALRFFDHLGACIDRVANGVPLANDH